MCSKHFVLQLVPVYVLLPTVFVSEGGVHFLYILVCLVHNFMGYGAHVNVSEHESD
jgi:hypothetical protein